MLTCRRPPRIAVHSSSPRLCGNQESRPTIAFAPSNRRNRTSASATRRNAATVGAGTPTPRPDPPPRSAGTPSRRRRHLLGVLPLTGRLRGFLALRSSRDRRSCSVAETGLVAALTLRPAGEPEQESAEAGIGPVRWLSFRDCSSLQSRRMVAGRTAAPTVAATGDQHPCIAWHRALRRPFVSADLTAEAVATPTATGNGGLHQTLTGAAARWEPDGAERTPPASRRDIPPSMPDRAGA